jgi:hypothetical protein
MEQATRNAARREPAIASLIWDREEAVSLLSPSGGSTQAGTTSSVAFQALLSGEHVDLMVAL